MGVPKFFRYISERYPCLSELIKEYQIPEFDNLYLDMNGIIHMCSHPDDFDPHFRISEERIMTDIFHYLEVLFRMIKPKKLFFMAVDGVAPRAKMNQQRGRRFRSAKDAEKLQEQALKKGQGLPTEARFDSNCITPGTIFMAKLNEQLKYFIVNKITNDNLWKKCKVILSGHETPGEGEHKIMDYIRYMRAQPGYDPNTRHCLYGLDADLMMLGLCTHEPHFSLLREEVRFGKKSTKRKSIPEQINFYLFHLSLMREYLDMEFSALKTTLPFAYNFENIIDDWVLMSFLVGNDFIPHLPNFHIASGALPLLYNAYMKLLPTLDGYINDGGILNLDRFEKFMNALCAYDMDKFSETYADLKYFESKTGRRPNGKERTSYKTELLKEMIIIEPTTDQSPSPPPEPEKAMDSGLASLIKSTNSMFLEPSEENLIKLVHHDEDDREDVDCADSGSNSGSHEDDYDDDLMDLEFEQHKRDYYMNKLEYLQVTPEVMRSQAEGYVRAIQWNLHYYYNGVCSWSWYYPHHYSPFISDIKDFKDLKLEYDMGKPFFPYEQLLAVLPAASKDSLPQCYHKLMTEPDSAIIDYYPETFDTDLNGKKQDWEALVLIPFIDENRLLSAMAPCNLELTEEETKRNMHGPMLVYEYSKDALGDYDAPEYYPVVKNHRAICTPLDIKDIRIPIEKLIKGAYPGAEMNTYYPGFPTFKHLKYSGKLSKEKVKVFEQLSREENMIVKILYDKPSPTEEIACKMIGTSVFVNWPHLVEAMVISVSDENYEYRKTNMQDEVESSTLTLKEKQIWHSNVSVAKERALDRMGIDFGDITVLVRVNVLVGRKYVFSPQGVISLEKIWAKIHSEHPLQAVVENIPVFYEKMEEYLNIDEVFTVGLTCFLLGQPHYGSEAIVQDSKASLAKGRVTITTLVMSDPNFERIFKIERDIRLQYIPHYAVAKSLSISNELLGRITGSLIVYMGEDDTNKQNIGLNLKNNRRNECVPGYTKKEKFWMFSQRAVDLIKLYIDTFGRMLAYVQQNIEQNYYAHKDLFAGEDKTAQDVITWIKNQPFYSLECRSSLSSYAEPEIVEEIEKLVSEDGTIRLEKKVVMQVKPHVLYKPTLQYYSIPPDEEATYELYDRVTMVREGLTVPLGYTGTVIAIHRSESGKCEDVMYDVLFDKSFAGGMSLNCSPNRGYRLSRLSLVNRTHGLRQIEKRTGKPGHLIQQLTSSSNVQQQQQPFNYRSGPQNQRPYKQNSAFASWINPYQNVQQQYQQPAGMPLQMFNVPPPQVAPPKQILPRAPPPCQNMFMPSFSEPATSAPQAPDQNSDFLRKMLKIDQPAPSLQSVSVQDMFAHASGQMSRAPPAAPPAEPPANSAAQSHSLNLLTYYQEQGLGCPHYTYMQTPNGLYKAQLTMPITGEFVFGEFLENKEMACENVARTVLERLKNGTGGNNTKNIKLPTPPRQWCQSDNQNKAPSSQQTSKPAKNKFVPLQAVKHQHQKNSAEASVKENVPAEDVTTKPKRERKMRIAANFSGSS